MIVSALQLQIIYGSLLGDGCLDRPKPGNSRLIQRHSERDEHYARFKHAALRPLSLGLFKHVYLDRRTGKTYSQIGFNTVRDRFFTELYWLFYRNNVKHVPEIILAQLNEVALAVFVGDDGTFDRSSSTVKISVDRYDMRDRQLIRRWLAERFGIEATIQKDRIYILRRSYQQLINTMPENVLPYISRRLGFP